MNICSRPDYDTFRQTKRFGSLDALRCFSVLAVIFTHTVQVDTRLFAGIQLGTSGVGLFFSISGFLITTLLLREKQVTSDINLRDFYIRRGLRIFPLYYAVFGCYAIIAYAERHTYVGRDFFHNAPYFLTYTSNWFVYPKGVETLFLLVWSLSTEEQFYLCWPMFEKKLTYRWTLTAISIFCLFIVIYRLGCFGSVGADGTGPLPHPEPLFITVMDFASLPICLGVLVAHILHARSGYRFLARIWTRHNSWISIVLYAVCVVTASSTGMSYILRSFAGAFLILSCVQVEEHDLQKLFTWKPLVAFGMVSYGVYLLHLLCHHVVKVIIDRLPIHSAVLRSLVDYAVTVMVVYAAASFSYKYYESIFLTLKSRFEVPRQIPSIPAELHVIELDGKSSSLL